MSHRLLLLRGGECGQKLGRLDGRRQSLYLYYYYFPSSINNAEVHLFFLLIPLLAILNQALVSMGSGFEEYVIIIASIERGASLLSHLPPLVVRKGKRRSRIRFNNAERQHRRCTTT